LYAGRHVPEISRHADFKPLGTKHKPDRIDRIVGNRERENFNVANLEFFSRAKVLTSLEIGFIVILVELCLFARRSAHPTLPLLMRMCGNANRDRQLRCEHSSTGSLVLMLVRSDDGAQARQSLTDSAHAARP